MNIYIFSVNLFLAEHVLHIAFVQIMQHETFQFYKKRCMTPCLSLGVLSIL